MRSRQLPADPDASLIETERIRSVFQQAPLTLIVTIVNAVLTTVVLAPVVDHTLLFIWMALIIAISSARWLVRQMFLCQHLEDARIRPWAALSIIGSLTTGSVWGVGAAALLPWSETYQLFLAFVIGGMCAGASSVNSAHLPSVVAFVLPASLPLAANFLAQGATPQVVSALMIFIFASALCVSSLGAHRAFGERIRLQLVLDRQQRALSNTNQRLREEVAERQNAQAMLHQAQKMDAIGQLTGGIAHDFNNMLQAISGNLEMGQRRLEQDCTADIGRYLKIARDTVDRAGQLTHRLLTFARRQTLDPKPVEPIKLIDGMVNLLRHTVGPDIPVRLCTDDATWRVLCDAHQLESALLNLCINARDAMPEGGRLTVTSKNVYLSKVDVVAQEGALPGEYVELAVTDTGTGMTAEVLARAFEPFFTTKPIGQGTGLGLSQVYGLLRQFHGAIKLESELKLGTTVRLYLPRHERVRTEDEQRTAETEPTASSAGETVLLVEDEVDVRLVAGERLRELGYQVMEAGDGRTALHALAIGRRVDLLVTDVGLPDGLNGRQLAEIARQRRPTLSVLFITGYVGRGLEEQLAPGMAVIGKPFTLDALAMQIRRMLTQANVSIGARQGDGVVAGGEKDASPTC